MTFSNKTETYIWSKGKEGSFSWFGRMHPFCRSDCTDDIWTLFPSKQIWPINICSHSVGPQKKYISLNKLTVDTLYKKEQNCDFFLNKFLVRVIKRICSVDFVQDVVCCLVYTGAGKEFQEENNGVSGWTKFLFCFIFCLSTERRTSF